MVVIAIMGVIMTVVAAPASIVAVGVGIVSEHCAPLLARLMKNRPGLGSLCGAIMAGNEVRMRREPSVRFALILGACVGLRCRKIRIHSPRHRIGHALTGIGVREAAFVGDVTEETRLDQDGWNVWRQQHEEPCIAVRVAQERRNLAQAGDNHLRELRRAIGGFALRALLLDAI